MTKFFISDINFNNINSELYNNLLEDYGEKINEIKLGIELQNNILEDFNNRNINPRNINEIIKLSDYLLITDLLQFILENSEPTFEKYPVEQSYIEQFNFPKFFTQGLLKNDDYKLFNIKNVKTNKNQFIFKPKIFTKFSIFNKISVNLFYPEEENIFKYDLLEWLKFICKTNKISEDFISYIACVFNSTKCLDYSMQLGHKNNAFNLWISILHNNFNLFKFLLKQDIDFDFKIPTIACVNGNVEYLKYLKNYCQEKQIKFPINDECFVNACFYNNLDCLKFLIDNNCEIKYDSYLKNVVSYVGNIKFSKYMMDINYKEYKFLGAEFSFYNLACINYNSTLNHLNFFKFMWKEIIEKEEREKFGDSNQYNRQESIFNVYLDNSIKNNKIFFFKYFLENTFGYYYNYNKLLIEICKFGNIEFLQFFYDEYIFKELNQSKYKHLYPIFITNKGRIEAVEEAIKSNPNCNNYKFIQYLFKIIEDYNMTKIIEHENEKINLIKENLNLCCLNIFNTLLEKYIVKDRINKMSIQF